MTLPPSKPSVESEPDSSKKEPTSSSSSSISPDASTLEASETLISLPQNAKPFLITRLLRTILPRSWTTWKGDILSRSKDKTSNRFQIWDYLFYSSSWRLVWASALGHPFDVGDFPELDRKRKVSDRTAAFERPFRKLRGEDGDGVGDGRGKKRKSRFPLLFALLTVFRGEIVEGLLCNLVGVWMIVSQVLLYKIIMEYLIHFYQHSDPVPNHSYSEGVAYMFASASTIFIYSLLDIRGHFILSIVGGEMRTLVAAAVTRKSLVISPLARRRAPESHSEVDTLKEKTEADLRGEEQRAEEKEAESELSAGTVLNLVNTDAERIQIGMRRLNKAWPVVVGIPLIMAYSYWLIGWPGPTSSSIVICLLFPVIPLVRALSRLRIRLNVATDIRVSKVNDLVTGIRLLKAYAWGMSMAIL